MWIFFPKQTHTEDFLPFLEGTETIAEYCGRQVDPFGVDCEHLQIVALTQALEFPVCVAYLDRVCTEPWAILWMLLFAFWYKSGSFFDHKLEEGFLTAPVRRRKWNKLLFLMIIYLVFILLTNEFAWMQSRGDHVSMHTIPETSQAKVHVMYRPGHYDIIYPGT